MTGSLLNPGLMLKSMVEFFVSAGDDERILAERYLHQPAVRCADADRPRQAGDGKRDDRTSGVCD